MQVPRTSCLLLLACASVCAQAQVTPPDYGFQWSTITHPGNRAATMQEAPHVFPPWSDPALPIGSVGHVYRMATTEVSIAQWHEFVLAYAPYYTGSPNDDTFTSFWIDHAGGQQYVIRLGAAARPAGMAWRYAARYVNWLHNDKRLDRDAFETGVYDTSTFSTNSDGTFNDQREHAPDARYWIPTLDELVKAVYYDPDRYGEGQDGYWLYPNGTNTTLISGYPEEGGETSAGLSPGAPNARWLDIGSYSNVSTPWGLLDASGGVAEWTEGVNLDGTSRFAKGTGQFDPGHATWDRLDEVGGLPPHLGVFVGLRLASAVPSPGALSGLVLFSWFFHTRRNRNVAGTAVAPTPPPSNSERSKDPE